MTRRGAAGEAMVRENETGGMADKLCRRLPESMDDPFAYLTPSVDNSPRCKSERKLESGDPLFGLPGGPTADRAGFPNRSDNSRRACALVSPDDPQGQ